MATVRDVVDALDRRYPPRLAEEWDRVGLSVGDPDDEVRHIHLAVDPVLAVVDEALAAGAQMIVTHHPLMLRGVTTVAADTGKGAVVHRLIRAGCALYAAHTNADAAAGGVADALAAAFGLGATEPLVPDGADPALGQGRVGVLSPPATLRAFAERVAAALPSTPQGVRVAGDLDATVTRVAVLGGSGGSLLDAAIAADVDVYVTGDFRHHPASEAREDAAVRDGRPALIDVSHFASESLWLRDAADYLARETGVTTSLSTLVTEPWNARFGADPE
jgi:dinuclear metal center YbgI/SA1388 family protein